MNKASTKEYSGPIKRGPAWQAAEAAGLDMSLVELSLSKTPWERLLDHDDALSFAEQLKAAGRTHYAKPKCTLEAAD